jgi:hypothetical protein
MAEVFLMMPPGVLMWKSRDKGCIYAHADTGYQTVGAVEVLDCWLTDRQPRSVLEYGYRGNSVYSCELCVCVCVCQNPVNREL